jgi:ADP-heptose:LPS heptosyltransferase
LNQWDLLAPLGIPAGDPARDPVEMPADSAAEARVDRWLAHAGIEARHSLVVVHVSAGNPFRQWPAAYFAALIGDLARRDPSRHIIVTSGPSDANAARAIVEEVRAADARAGAAIWHVDFDLVELRALIVRAAVYIGGDSGPLHVAATTTTPIVGLFGPTLAERSIPWRDPRYRAEAVDAGSLACRPCEQRTCAPKDFRCLTRIDPARVAAAAERLIRSGRDLRVVDA